ncbi:MAG TPA: hypothetical protein VH720_13730 [Candidatus Limnocylindrales bacterium]
MDGLLVLFGIIAALTFLGMAAIAFGVDSRDGSTDPRSPVRPTGIA